MTMFLKVGLCMHHQYYLMHQNQMRVQTFPISCFLTYVPDSLEGLIDHSSELRWLSVKGGGGWTLE